MASRYNPFSNDVPEDIQDIQTERVQRSQELLQKLYHAELNPRFRAPVIRGLRLVIALSLLTILFFTASILLKFNHFIGMQEDVYSSVGMLEASIQRRSNLFNNLVQITLNHATLEHAIFAHVSDVRKELINKTDLTEQDKIQVKSTPPTPAPSDSPSTLPAAIDGTAFGQLLAVVEQYPDIQSAETYKTLMKQIVEIEDRIAQRRTDLVDKIRFFNTEISRFPWHILARYTRFSRFEYFEADNNSHVTPVINKKSYENLLPFK